MVVFVTVTSVVVALVAEQLPDWVATDTFTSKPLAGQEAPAALVHTTDTVEFEHTANRQHDCSKQQTSGMCSNPHSARLCSSDAMP